MWKSETLRILLRTTFYAKVCICALMLNVSLVGFAIYYQVINIQTRLLPICPPNTLHYVAFSWILGAVFLGSIQLTWSSCGNLPWLIDSDGQVRAEQASPSWTISTSAVPPQCYSWLYPRDLGCNPSYRGWYQLNVPGQLHSQSSPGSTAERFGHNLVIYWTKIPILCFRLQPVRSSPLTWSLTSSSYPVCSRWACISCITCISCI